ncbi:MAG: Hsp20/alpha crystallin family protein [Patescibacteria group bacterium]
MSSTNLTDWFTQTEEGQLSVDVFREGDVLVIRSFVAGVEPENLDIAVNGDLLTIRGRRQENKQKSEDDVFYQECYWGSFSRSIILPYHVAADATEAQIKNGILEIRIPIRKDGKQVKVKWGK